MSKALLLLIFPLLASGAGVDGTWILHGSRLGEPFPPARVELKTEGRNVTGTLNELTLAGTFEGNHLHLSAKRPSGDQWGTFDGTLKAGKLSGTGKVQGDDFTWNAASVQNGTAAPSTHTFTANRFHRVFSGAIPPALHLNPGDTVQTTTVDAGGWDGKGIRRSEGGNPQTGPFYIEGALPGDTLAIHFNRIRLNRDTAMSGDRVVPSAVEPDYYRDAKYDEKFNSGWTLDRANGTASLTQPTEHLKPFRVKLQPMLGCVGVAPPADQSFRSGWLGPWGGNMDYSGLREGVTVYLPVFQEGALLFVGDGHALEGDGELNGDALETSMDVEFTVNLVRGKNTRGPRFENDEYLMASGIGGSLNDALQKATTELARWLERDYKLTANESNIVLGTSIHYDIAEVVDPQVHIVARISKAVLAQLAR